MVKVKGEICLFLAALIWGTAFVFQKMGMDYIGPFTFGFFRFGIGALVLLPVIYFTDKVKRKKRVDITDFKDSILIKGSILCGIANFAAGSLQQIGIVYTTAGKAGFITSLDIVIVPILLIFMKQKVKPAVWIGAAIASVGLYLLCITDGFSIGIGDSFVIACAFAYSGQILLIDYFADKTDPIKLSCLQFLLAGILSGIIAVPLEGIDFTGIVKCAVPILYTAILEVGAAFTLQIVGQKYVQPAVAAIIMSLEAVFSAISGALVLHETMAGRELTGCVLMFAAFLIAQSGELKSLQKNR
jgi:drug/metabolite transporter (DMT)-like permease